VVSDKPDHVFIIAGEPIAKKRPRFVRTGLKGVRTYSLQATEEGRVLWEIIRQFGEGIEPMLGALRVDMEFVSSRAKSHYGTGRNAAKLKTSAPKFHVKKNDLDNNYKFYLDAMNQYIYVDDAQVVCGYIEKRYADHGESARTIIIITELE